MMGIYISTNMYATNQLEQIFTLLDLARDKTIGIELFVQWHDGAFTDFVRENLDRLLQYNSSLHGPYYHTEHSKPQGSEEYTLAKQYFISTLELSQKLRSKYIVYHHNNCCVKPENKQAMIKYSSQNLLELNELAKAYAANIVVENAGVLSHNNMLFDQKEFVDLAQAIGNKILIDVGHAFANGWNLEEVIATLSHKIVAYHLHNNDGVEDQHNRITDGNLNIDSFVELYKKYTPKADLVIEYSPKCATDSVGILKDIKCLLHRGAC